MAKKATTVKTELLLGVGSLPEIVAAGEQGMFTTLDVYGPLVESGHVEINPEITNEHGHIATRATAKGIASLNNVTETQPGALLASKPSFEIEYGIEPAKAGRVGSGGKTELYPFNDLTPPNAEGQKASFFVPGKTMKTMSSTISGATRRYAEADPSGATKPNRKGVAVPVLVQTRKFHGEDTTKNGVAGVRVFRDA